MNVTIFWTCATIAVVVFGVMIYSVATFRGPQQGATGSKVGLRHGAVVEVLWALIPIVILVAAVLPAAKMLGPPVMLAGEIAP